MTAPRLGLPDLGVGVGLRVPHYRHVLTQKPPVDFFEVISENFMVDGGKPLANLEQVLSRYPVVQHGVSLGIGNPEPPRADYVRRLRALAERVGGPWLSDHFCWTSAGGVDLHDLLPLPGTEEAAQRLIERARQLQDTLGVRFALENASSYLNYTSTHLREWEFVSAVVEEADIGLLLDVNNVYVAAYNHGFDPYEYLNALPLERVVQIHVAGHTNLGTHIVDTHNGDVSEPVWELYRYAVECTGGASTLVEWDSDLAKFEDLMAVAERAKAVRGEALAARAGREAQGLEARPPPLRGRPPAHPPPDVDRRPHRPWEQGGPRESASAHLAAVLDDDAETARVAP